MSASLVSTGLAPNATTNLNLGPGSRCVVEFPTSNSVAFLLLGAMNINGAQLNAEVTYPIRAGEVLSVAAPYPSRFHKGYVAWTAGRQRTGWTPAPATTPWTAVRAATR